jgi:hypothetical protein
MASRQVTRNGHVDKAIRERLNRLYARAKALNICDDSPWLQARSFWNDTGVSSHTVRSVHAHERDKLKATHVSHGTMYEHGRVFTHGPAPWNPSKRDLVENVQQNFLRILFVLRKAEIPILPAGRRHSFPCLKPGAFWSDLGKTNGSFIDHIRKLLQPSELISTPSQQPN